MTEASQWDASQWGSFVMAPGDPAEDAIDLRRTVPELSGLVDRPVAEIVNAIEAGKLRHLCKGDVTVSLREWSEYKAKETQ